MKGGGSLPRGRKRRDEVPGVPATEQLSRIQREAQDDLRALVERAGGRFDPADPVPVEGPTRFVALFNEWATRYGEATDYGTFFAGRPGLWHALDELYPLQDPNRWDRLRHAIIEVLEGEDWRRRRPPRGSAFEIRDRDFKGEAG